MHCPECGFINAEGANYCQKCGAFLGEAEQGKKPGDTTEVYQVDEAGDLKAVDVGGPVEPVAAGCAPRREQLLVLQIPDLRDRDVGELALELLHDGPDREGLLLARRGAADDLGAHRSSK